jgi:hypothetical protein
MNQNRGVQGVREEFLPNKSFNLSLARAQECKECMGDKNNQGDQGHKR